MSKRRELLEIKKRLAEYLLDNNLNKVNEEYANIQEMNDNLSHEALVNSVLAVFLGIVGVYGLYDKQYLFSALMGMGDLALLSMLGYDVYCLNECGKTLTYLKEIENGSIKY